MSSLRDFNPFLDLRVDRLRHRSAITSDVVRDSGLRQDAEKTSSFHKRSEPSKGLTSRIDETDDQSHRDYSFEVQKGVNSASSGRQSDVGSGSVHSLADMSRYKKEHELSSKYGGTHDDSGLDSGVNLKHQFDELDQLIKGLEVGSHATAPEQHDSEQTSGQQSTRVSRLRKMMEQRRRMSSRSSPIDRSTDQYVSDDTDPGSRYGQQMSDSPTKESLSNEPFRDQLVSQDSEDVDRQTRFGLDSSVSVSNESEKQVCDSLVTDSDSSSLAGSGEQDIDRVIGDENGSVQDGDDGDGDEMSDMWATDDESAESEEIENKFHRRKVRPKESVQQMPSPTRRFKEVSDLAEICPGEYGLIYQVKVKDQTVQTVKLAVKSIDLTESEGWPLQCCDRDIKDMCEDMRCMGRMANKNFYVVHFEEMVVITDWNSHLMCGLFTELLDGNLEKLLKDSNTLMSEKVGKCWLSQIGYALQFLHNKCRIVHNDIQASNVLYFVNGGQTVGQKSSEYLLTKSTFKLADFGEAVHYPSDDNQFEASKQSDVNQLGHLLHQVLHGWETEDPDKCAKCAKSHQLSDLLHQIIGSEASIDKVLEHNWI